MRKWLSIGLVIVVALSLVIGILSPAVVSAKEKSAADTVTAYVKALPNLKKTAVTAGYWVTDKQAGVKAQLDAIPKDTKISMKLAGKLKTTGQDGGPATVTGTYKVDLQLKKQKQSLGQKTITFTLDKKGDPKKYPWLISNSDLDLKSLSIGATPAPTATPGPGEPVKIGAICSWSGPAAVSGVAYGDPIIKLVETQVKNMGGLLGGRELKIVKYDNAASTVQAAAGARKLLFDEGVIALTMGGVSAAECEAVAAFAEENVILYTPFSSITGLAKMKYVLGAMPPIEVTCKGYIDLAIKILKAKTIGFLGAEIVDARERIKITKDAVEAAGINVLYEDYITPGTIDFSPYLTKLKYANPDVVIMESSMNEFYITIAKQLPDIGGLGNMKVGCLAPADAVMSKPAADGWYISTLWYTDLNTEGSKKFVNDYKALFGKSPTATDVYFYNSVWLSVAAIMKANTTDRVKLANFGRSGKLEWDLFPQGPAQWGKDGLSDMPGFLVQIKDKQLVFVEKLQR